MPDSIPAPPRSGTLPRIAGLALVVAGAAGLVTSAFLYWHTVTAHLPAIAAMGGLPSELKASVTGLGSVSMPTFNGQDLSSAVPRQTPWGGAAVICLAIGALLMAVVGALGPANRRLVGALGAAAFGVVGVGFGLYALLVPVGTQTVTTRGVTLRVETVAAIGPYVVIGAAAAVLIGAIVLFLARRSAVPAPAPAVPAQPAGPQAPMPPIPPQPRMQPGYAPSNPQLPPADAAWARPVPPPLPAPLPEAQTRTAVAPVAQRRPQPDWDRNWPTTVPPQPGPAVPSEQRTQIVKRPPRPVKVSPKPETEAIPRRDPRFDSPTQP